MSAREPRGGGRGRGRLARDAGGGGDGGGTARARERARRAGGADLRARVLVAIPAVVILLAAIYAGGDAFAISMFVFGVICLHELYAMLAEYRPVRIAGFLGIGGMIAAAHLGTQYHLVLAMAAVVPVLFVLTMTGPGREQPIMAMSTTLLGVYWIGLGVAHATLLRDLPHGDAILIDVCVGTFLGDTGAYLGGRMFGRRRLAPSISPNKTVEGLAIGIVTAVVAVWFAGLYQDWLSGTDALLLGLAVAIVAPIGDLFESALKRAAGTKDTGTLFGAHGGALDRVDAVLFAVVAGYYVWVTLL